MTYDAVELFAGPGGSTLGAHSLGLKTVGIEWDQAACDTRRAAGLATIQADVREVSPMHPSLITEGLMASPSCQSFSMAGNGKGRKQLDLVLEGLNRVVNGQEIPEYDDPRTGLTLEPMRWIKARYDEGLPFTWIFLEQVPGVRPVWDAYAEHLREMGYNGVTETVRAEQWGVPQTRKRAVLLAHLYKPVETPKPTHMPYKKGVPQSYTYDGLLPWVSMADALGTVDTMRSNYGTGGDPANRGERPADTPAPTMTSKAGRNKWIPTLPVNNQSGTEFDYVEQAGTPASTIAGRGMVPFRGANANRFNGATKSRNDGFRVTAQEAAMLQTFPSSHEFLGSKGKQFEMIGNAVPCLLAKTLLRGLTDGNDNE